MRESLLGFAKRPLIAATSKLGTSIGVSVLCIKHFQSVQPTLLYSRCKSHHSIVNSYRALSGFENAQNSPIKRPRPNWPTPILYNQSIWLDHSQRSFANCGLRGFASKSSPNEPAKINVEKEPEKVKEANADKIKQEAKAGSKHDFRHTFHRPTRDELLAAASGLFERLKIRIQWPLIRSRRRFSLDDISGLFSWILVGNLLWIVLGTTTFVSLLIYTLNTVMAQDYIARFIGSQIAKSTGITVVFENAIVPNWKDGVIAFNKVFVSRRPGKSAQILKGSQSVAAAAAKVTNETEEEAEIQDAGNYTQFDLTIDTVAVTLSFSKWLDGKGIVDTVEVKGLRGVVDRRHVKWKEGVDPRSYKNVHKPGDFEIDGFKMEDALVTLYQPGENVRPINVSIFNCELPLLRKHWLMYDILSANNMSGSYDNSLFTIHPRQRFVEDEKESPWKKVSRLRIDSVDIRHFNRGISGPFGWIESGTVDLLADLSLPADVEQLKLSEVLQDIVERWENNVISRNKSGEEFVTSIEERQKAREAHKYIVIDLRVQLNNTRAVVPFSTPEMSYINSALIRPIVAYINSRDTYIPINCRVVKKLADFEGSWTIYDSQLMDDVSAEVYDAFAKNVVDDEARALRMKKVSMWSFQLAAQLLLLSLGALS